jgi:hypothetical protein
MGNKSSAIQIVDRNNLEQNDRDTIYQCVAGKEIFLPVVAKSMTHLMKLVLLTREHPDLLTTISAHIANHPDELEMQNSKGWTALSLAVANSCSCSTIDTVKLLLNLGANVNGGKIKPIMVAALYAGSSSSSETFFLLCDQPNIDYTVTYRSSWGIFSFHSYMMRFAVWSEPPDILIIHHLIRKGCGTNGYDNRIATIQRMETLKKLDELKGSAPSDATRTLADMDFD